MKQRYPFYDLTGFTWTTNLISILPGALCIAGLIHGYWSWQELSAMGPDSALALLSVETRERLEIDTFIREAQVATTLILVLFYTWWVYFASRNMVSLFEDHVASWRESIKLFLGLIARLHKITRLIDAMRYDSIPPDHDHKPAAWLLPIWSLSLISANVCKLTAVYLMADALTVGDFQTVMTWAFCAYALYLIFYLVTARITFEVVWLQKLSHDHHISLESGQEIS